MELTSMKQALKNLTPSGISRKKTDNFKSLRFYLIFGLLLFFVAFAVYSQILIRNANLEQEYVPRIFARYIAYTDTYLRRSEKYAQMLGELSSKHFESAQKLNYNEAIGDYILTDFMPHNPIPIVITDIDMEPLVWSQVNVSQDSTFSELSQTSRDRLLTMLDKMNRTEIKVNGQITNYAYYARPVSLQEFIKGIDYSVVVADRSKIPRYWRNMDIPESQGWEETNGADRRRLLKKLADMDEVPLGDASDQLGYIYFTAPKSLSRIRSLVLLELGLVLLFIAFGSYGLFLLHRTEKDTLWIGLAKETAHQFGTPITSLMGWLDILRESPPESVGGPELNKMIDYMTVDLNQLKIIASRFGKVGSQTKLLPTELHTILEEIVSYFRDRMPHLGSRIDLHLISKIQGIRVMLDTELFKWTLENLIKNCVDAMSQKGGNIFITATHNDKYAYVHIRDEGKGIPHSQWKKIFEPGVTTKNRGWGLGLSLAKRIIEEYHHGTIRVIESTVNEGSTFEIRLNTEHSS
jgi:signal transduction histidine kinase